MTGASEYLDLSFRQPTFLPIASEGVNRAPVWTRDGYVSPISPSATASATSCRSQAIRARLPKACSRARATSSFRAAGRQTAVRSSTSTQRLPATDNSELRVLPIEGREVETLSDIPAAATAGGLARRPLARLRHPASEASGRPAIYVRPFPGPGPSRQFVDAAGQPVWSRDGEKIFFRSRRGGSSASSGDGIFEMPSIVRVGSRPARNGNCSGNSLPKMRGLALPVTTSRLTVDSCWSSPTNRNRSRVT